MALGRFEIMSAGNKVVKHEEPIVACKAMLPSVSVSRKEMTITCNSTFTVRYSFSDII